jgi:hypothetical protein
VELTAEDRSVLEALQRSTTVKAGLGKRVRIVLLRAEGQSVTSISRTVDLARLFVYKWVERYNRQGVAGLVDKSGRARQLVAEGVVSSISPTTVWRILAHHKLKPWRTHYWLNRKAPRDAEFYARVNEVIDLYTRPLSEQEAVLSVDEKTSLQPRSRLHPTKPAQPGLLPNYVEHEYHRKGSLQLFAAFDTRTGKVYGQGFDRKRQKEFIAFLEYLDREIPASMTLIHLVLDNVSTHHGKQVRGWLKDHPRCQLHFTPVHCSWMNQVEQWFGIL